MFLLQKTLRFAESYSDPEDTSSLYFDDKNGAYYLWMKFLSSFIDISLFALIEWIGVTSTYSSVLSISIVITYMINYLFWIFMRWY